jgi:hypothetical protein
MGLKVLSPYTEWHRIKAKVVEEGIIDAAYYPDREWHGAWASRG